jgi:type VI secretion system protein ImpB
MKSSNLGIDLVVEDKLSGEPGNDLAVHLDLEGMSSFEPDEIVKQIPELSRLMAARNLLHDLRNRLVSVKDFRKQLETVIKDDELRAKLLSELDNVVASDESGAASDDES